MFTLLVCLPPHLHLSVYTVSRDKWKWNSNPESESCNCPLSKLILQRLHVRYQLLLKTMAEGRGKKQKPIWKKYEGFLFVCLQSLRGLRHALFLLSYGKESDMKGRQIKEKAEMSADKRSGRKRIQHKMERYFRLKKNDREKKTPPAGKRTRNAAWTWKSCFF